MSGRDGRDLGAEGAPASIRLADGRTPPVSVRGTRSDELASLYRKIADMQVELADAEARHEKARAESASADEMVGQMLARVSEVEARLRTAQADRDDAEARAETAEARAGELAAQLGAAHLQINQLRDDLAVAGHDADVNLAEIESLRARLLREQEERETLRQRVVEFAQVCEERDAALLREELIDAELGAVRGELAEAKLQPPAAAAETRHPAPALAARRLHAELVAAQEGAARASEQLRLAVESVGRAMTDLEGEGPDAPRAAFESGPVLAPLVGEAEDDEPTTIFGDLARELALELRERRG